MKTLDVFQKALLANGMNFSATLSEEKVTVRVFDRMTNATIGQSSSDSLEAALANVLATAVSETVSYEGLSRL